jgi:hypothetical protein
MAERKPLWQRAGRAVLWHLMPCPLALLTLVVGLEGLAMSDELLPQASATDTDQRVAAAVMYYEPWQGEEIASTARAIAAGASAPRQANNAGDKREHVQSGA